MEDGGAATLIGHPSGGDAEFALGGAGGFEVQGPASFAIKFQAGRAGQVDVPGGGIGVHLRLGGAGDFEVDFVKTAGEGIAFGRAAQGEPGPAAFDGESLGCGGSAEFHAENAVAARFKGSFRLELGGTAQRQGGQVGHVDGRPQHAVFLVFAGPLDGGGQVVQFDVERTPGYIDLDIFLQVVAVLDGDAVMVVPDQFHLVQAADGKAVEVLEIKIFGQYFRGLLPRFLRGEHLAVGGMGHGSCRHGRSGCQRQGEGEDGKDSFHGMSFILCFV